MEIERIGKHGTIIFDGSCGSCSVFIGEKRAFFEKHGFTVVPLQERWIRELSGLEEAELSQAIHLLTTDRKIYQGIDLFQYVAGKIRWLTPIYLLLRIKWLRPFYVKLYDWIALRRQKISKVCRLKSRALYK